MDSEAWIATERQPVGSGPTIHDSRSTIPPFTLRLFRAARLWALPASITPVLFGTAAAVTAEGASMRRLDFALALLGVACLHAGANLLSDWFDHARGVDREPVPHGSVIPHGWLSPRQVFAEAVVCLAAGCGIGLALAWRGGWPILLVGAAGVIVAVGYAAPPLGAKYRRLGDLAILLDFGMLPTLGAWALQTGSFDPRPVIWSLPLSLLAVAILHANNWRDRARDAEAGSRTVAGALGEAGSYHYYRLLVAAPFLIVAGLCGWRLMAPGSRWSLPGGALAALLAAPWARRCLRQAARGQSAPADLATLDAATARLNLMFGLLLTAGMIIS